MALTKCVECGKEISNSAKVCPHCGKKDPIVSNAQKLIGVAVFIILGIVILYSIISNNNETPSVSQQNSISSSSEVSSLVYPNLQIQFHQLNSTYPTLYSRTNNEIKKSDVFNRCNSSRLNYAEKIKFSFNNWVGEIQSISTDQGGDNAEIVITSESSNFGITYRTYNNTFSDIGTESMLKKGTKVYDQVGNLSEGQLVKFSGRFVLNVNRGIEESSLTEEGCVNEPEFIIIFSNIVRY